jgi:MFS family permease
MTAPRRTLQREDDERAAAEIPARLDRLPWTPRHWRLVAALGAGWVLDGLQVTITGAIAPALQYPETLSLTPQEIGLSASSYVAGAVLGALAFGMLADRFGRRRIFYLTLGLSLLGMAASGLAIGFISFTIARAVTGGGIGGEYTAVNAAVDEWMPARLRGRINLAVNGSYWLGAALGAGLSIVLLDTRWFPIAIGWRIGCASGGVLGLAVLFARRLVPESPRWLARHGRAAEAVRLVRAMEDAAERWSGQSLPPPCPAPPPPAPHAGRRRGRLRLLLGRYRRRSALVILLMAAQAFLFNAVFFTYGLVLSRFYSIADRATGRYLLVFCLSNLFGPLVLGRFFDSIGRRRMLVVSFGGAGLLLLAVTLLFLAGVLSAETQTLGWMVVFFFASAAASAAYLTASEVFPLAMRGFALALFFALGTLVGGVLGPALYGRLIMRGSRLALAEGYALAAALMLLAAVAAAWLGVDAEGKSLESISE